MNQLTIDIRNGILAPKMSHQKSCRTSYARVVKFLDGKERVKPEVYEDVRLHIFGRYSANRMVTSHERNMK